MKIRISSVDHAPGGLYGQTPFEAELLREMPGRDRPDYWLAAPDRPLRWVRDDAETRVAHIVVVARLAGTRVGRGMGGIPVGIAYVVDESLLADAELDFRKCVYVAVGFAEELPGGG